MIRRTIAAAAVGMLLATLLASAPASAQGKKVTVATPGIPPIFSVMIAYVADKQGFFKKYGVDVEIKPFDNGTAAVRGSRIQPTDQTRLRQGGRGNPLPAHAGRTARRPGL